MGEIQKLPAAECTEFLARLESLNPARHQPTQGGEDLYEFSTRGSELANQVCIQDCVVALATEELQRHLSVALIQAAKPQRAVILGDRICEDEILIGALQRSLSVQVHALRSPWCWSWDGFEGVYLMEPDVFMTFLAAGLTWTSFVPVLILRDFEHYLNPRHPYRKIVLLFQDCRERKSSSTMRLLAIVNKLEVCNLDAFELELKKLRTPLSLTCCLGTPSRPYCKDVVLEICPIRLRQRSIDEAEFAYLHEQSIQGLDTKLLVSGITATRRHAEDTVLCGPRTEVCDFSSQFRSQLIELKGKALLDYMEGRSLALVSTAATQRTLKDKIRAQESVTIIEKPNDDAPEMPTVLVATMCNVPKLAAYRWDAVLFCDLPSGVECDALLRNARRTIALVTEFEWEAWKQSMQLHDDLDLLIKRVNE